MPDRREMLAALLAPALLARTSVGGRTPSVVVLDPGAVLVGMRVYDHGDGASFSLTLTTKPWPRVGDQIRFDYEGAHLLGTVQATEAEQITDGFDRFFYHVQGRALEFSGKEFNR